MSPYSKKKYSISVVIPCFNAARELPKAVQSVANQGVDGAEIIVVDDASTDNTIAVSERLSRKHDIRIIKQGSNQGPAAARNAGLEHANAPLICFLDADDEYDSGVFAAAFATLRKSVDHDGVRFRVTVIDCDRPIPPKCITVGLENSSPSNLILRTQFCRRIGGFPLDHRFRGKYAGEDLAFRLAVRRWGIIYSLNGVHLRYRYRPGGHFDLFLQAWPNRIEDHAVASAMNDHLAWVERRMIA